MGFQVNASAVRSYSKVLGGQALHTAEASEYLNKHAAVDDSSEGVIGPAWEFHHDYVIKAVDTAIGESQEFLEQCSDALAKAADHYEDLDEDEAKQFDEKYDDVHEEAKYYPEATDGDRLPDDGGPTGEASPQQQVDPTEELTSPGDPEGFEDPSKMADAFNDATSPMYWIRQILADPAVIGYDPVEHLATKLTGDWKALAKIGESYTNLARFYRSTSSNVREYVTLYHHWSGNACEQAMSYFIRSSDIFYNDDWEKQPGECTPEGNTYEPGTVWGYSGELNELGNTYRELAQDVAELTDVAINVIDDILNEAIWASVSAAAGKVTSWSGVGAVVGYGVAALHLESIVDKATKYTSTLTEIRDTITTFTNLNKDYDSAIHRLEDLELPKPYSHPGVD